MGSARILYLLLAALAIAACRSLQSRPSFVHAAGSPVSLGDRVGQPLLADMDGDERLDLIVPCAGLGDDGGGVAVLLGRGDGTFVARHPRIDVGWTGLKTAVGDIDGDGRPDLAVAAHDSHDVFLYRGTGDGRLERWTTVSPRRGGTPHTHSVAIADVDRDGHADLGVTQSEHGEISVLLGDGTGDFVHAPGSPFAAGVHPYEGLVLKDVNGDGVVDALSPDLHGNAVLALYGNGDGSLGPPEVIPAGTRPGFLAVGSADGGRVSVAVTHDDDPSLLLLTRGSTGWRSESHSLPDRAWGAAVADLDGDGSDEVLLGGLGDRLYLLRRGEVLSIPFGAGPPSTSAVAVGDVDGDGRLDVVSANFGGGVSVLLQR